MVSPATRHAIPVIDYFALALTHGLIALAVIRLMLNNAVDHEPEPGEQEAEPQPKQRKRRGRRA